MKILALGDIQICPESYKTVEEILDYTLSIFVEQDVDYVVLPGDIFEYPGYTNNYVSAATVIRPISNFINTICNIHGKQILLVDGNHDKSYGDFHNSTDIFINPKITHARDDVIFLTDDSCLFVMVPWLQPHELTRAGGKEFILDEIKKTVIKHKDLTPILIGHLRVIGSKENYYVVKNTENSFLFSTEELEELGIEYGILGDIHAHQRVVNKIDYMGSVKQRHAGEAGNPSLIRLLSVENGEVSDEYISIPNVPQYINLEASDEEDLVKILSQEFTSENKYRIQIKFKTDIVSPLPNVSFRKIHSNKNTGTKTKYNLSTTKTDAENLLKLYNNHHKIFNDDEIVSVISYWKSNG